MLDIEGLGKNAGNAILQIAAQYFNPYTGSIGAAFNIHVAVQSPFTIDPETLAWHEKQGTYPRTKEIESVAKPPATALFLFDQWIKEHRAPDVYWSWGTTYDFIVLGGAYEFYFQKSPWQYWQAQCARTVFKTLLPLTKPTPKPHDAAQDVLIQIKDLITAFQILKN